MPDDEVNVFAKYCGGVLAIVATEPSHPRDPVPSQSKKCPTPPPSCDRALDDSGTEMASAIQTRKLAAAVVRTKKRRSP
jgi:hypothetical protein